MSRLLMAENRNMQRLILGLFACGVATLVLSQPPDDGPGPGKKKGKDGKGPPPAFKVGKVLPPHVRDSLELSEEQQKKIADLEQEVRGKLEKILTFDQVRHAESIGPPPAPPGGPPQAKGPPDGPPPMNDDPGPPRGKKGKGPGAKERPPETSRSNPAANPATNAAANPATNLPHGIQWFATWESGLDEANRTGKPILLVSAAPHCAGVSGIW
jgi:hypothetical protein